MHSSPSSADPSSSDWDDSSQSSCGRSSDDGNLSGRSDEDGAHIYAQLCAPSAMEVNTYDFGNSIEFRTAKPAAPGKEKEFAKALPTEKKPPVAAKGKVKADAKELRNQELIGDQSIYACVAKQCCNNNCIYNYGTTLAPVTQPPSSSLSSSLATLSLLLH